MYLSKSSPFHKLRTFIIILCLGKFISCKSVVSPVKQKDNNTISVVENTKRDGEYFDEISIDDYGEINVEIDEPIPKLKENTGNDLLHKNPSTKLEDRFFIPFTIEVKHKNNDIKPGRLHAKNGQYLDEISIDDDYGDLYSEKEKTTPILQKTSSNDLLAKELTTKMDQNISANFRNKDNLSESPDQLKSKTTITDSVNYTGDLAIPMLAKRSYFECYEGISFKEYNEQKLIKTNCKDETGNGSRCQFYKIQFLSWRHVYNRKENKPADSYIEEWRCESTERCDSFETTLKYAEDNMFSYTGNKNYVPTVFYLRCCEKALCNTIDSINNATKHVLQRRIGTHSSCCQITFNSRLILRLYLLLFLFKYII